MSDLQFIELRGKGTWDDPYVFIEDEENETNQQQPEQREQSDEEDEEVQQEEEEVIDNWSAYNRNTFPHKFAWKDKRTRIKYVRFPENEEDVYDFILPNSQSELPDGEVILHRGKREFRGLINWSYLKQTDDPPDERSNSVLRNSLVCGRCSMTLQN